MHYKNGDRLATKGLMFSIFSGFLFIPFLNFGLAVYGVYLSNKTKKDPELIKLSSAYWGFLIGIISTILTFLWSLMFFLIIIGFLSGQLTGQSMEIVSVLF